MKTTKIILIAAIMVAVSVSGCQTTKINIQPVEFNQTWNQYQFNQVDTISKPSKIYQ